MNTVKGVFSKKSDEWETPEDLFAGLDVVYRFTLDVSADESNALCDYFYNAEDDGLSRPWNGRCWCNPPYSKAKDFVHKALNEIRDNEECLVVVMLLPSRTDTQWFHDLLASPFAYIKFIRGRLRFGGSKQNAPFPSILVSLTKQPKLR